MNPSVRFTLHSLRGLMIGLGQEIRTAHLEQFESSLPDESQLLIRYSSGGCGCGGIDGIDLYFGERHAPNNVQKALLDRQSTRGKQIHQMARRIFSSLITVGGFENWQIDDGGHGDIAIALNEGQLIRFMHYDHFHGARPRWFNPAWVNSPAFEVIPAPRIHRKVDDDFHVRFYEQEFYVLSNFSAFTLQWQGHRFDTSEAAYHYEKFRDTAPETAEAIRTAPSAHEAFKLADAHRDQQRPDWDDVKLDIMRAILRAKVDQHEYVRRKLLETGDRILVEDSWRDDFWGIGEDGKGQNWLGRLWMEVRDELLGSDKAESQKAVA